MSFVEERRAIENRFAANFTALPVWYENVPFEPPTSGGYVRFTIRNGTGEQASMNQTPLHRYAGVIIADIFVPEHTGTATARTHADAIEAIFRRAQFTANTGGTILCRTPTITTLGVTDGWFQISVSVAFQRDVTH
jgi:hypothetical protein